jgi:hypothetical protein
MLKLGSTTINKIRLGSTLINKVYLGSSQVYPTGGGGGGALEGFENLTGSPLRPNGWTFNDRTDNTINSSANTGWFTEGAQSWEVTIAGPDENFGDIYLYKIFNLTGKTEVEIDYSGYASTNDSWNYGVSITVSNSDPFVADVGYAELNLAAAASGTINIPLTSPSSACYINIQITENTTISIDNLVTN